MKIPSIFMGKMMCLSFLIYTDTYQYHIKSYSKAYQNFYSMMKTSGN